jgi:hypothetical protein
MSTPMVIIVSATAASRSEARESEIPARLRCP